MPSMKFLVLILAFTATLFSAPTASDWELVSHTPGWKYSGREISGSGGFVASFDLPTKYYGASFVLTPTVAGDLTGKTITATGEFTATGTPWVKYTGYNTICGNNPAPPAQARLYFQTTPNDYSDTDVAGSHQYWFAHSPIVIAPGPFTITASTSTLLWTDGQGHRSDSLTLSPRGITWAAEFALALQNAVKVGFGFGSNCAYDLGIGVVAGTGTMTFNLSTLTAQ